MRIELFDSDKELWESFLSGDRQAFSEIYNRHYGDLFAYGMKILDNREVVKDCIHDLFVKIYTHRNNLSTTVNISFYLLRSLRNIIQNTLRDSISYKDLSDVPFSPVEDDDLTDDFFSLSDADRANQLKLLEILKTLSDRQREIIHLRFAEELSLEEIAGILHINYQSVKNLLNRTLSKLRSAFISK
jgi:RNA polymerase sigma-70 factor (ECF subfamily)